VTDREAFDEFFPEDMVISFNEDTNVVPNGKNFTVTERSTLIVANTYTASGTNCICSYK